MSRFTAVVLALLAGLLGGCRSTDSGGNAAPPVVAPEAPAPQAGAPGVAWDWPAPSPASVGMPAADDREVAFTYGHEHLVLLDAKGGVRWEAARLGLRDVAPRLTPDLVLAATDVGVAAFRRADGSKAWDTPLAARANTPVVVGALAVTSTWEGQLVALGVGDGRVAWKAPLPGAAIGPPASDGIGVVVTWQAEGQRAAGALAAEGTTGRTRWAVAVEPGGVGGPTVTPDGAAVFVGGDLAAHALDLADGKERWRTPLQGAGSPEVPPVAVGADAVLVAHRLGGLDLLDTATGRRTWDLATDGIAVRGGPVAGPDRSFAFPLDDGRLVLAGPARRTETLHAPNRISGVVTGPAGLLVAATRGAMVNSVQARASW
ncbi:MAG: PQQ-binding-like beta-propeller repeat protein [Acidimicrobiales bacterium]